MKNRFENIERLQHKMDRIEELRAAINGVKEKLRRPEADQRELEDELSILESELAKVEQV